MKKISVFLSAVLMGMLVMVPVNAVNDYFTHSDRMASGAKVRAEQFNNVFDSIVTGLDKLPSQVQNNRGTRNYATATNVGNAYSATLSHVSGSYSAGQEVVFVASATNTDASTLNVSGIGASAIVNNDGSAVSAGVIQNGAIVHVRYNSARTAWELQGTYILSSGTSVSAFAATLLDDVDAAAMLVTLGSTPGTVTASDAVVVDANKDATGFRKITGSTSTGYTAEFTYTGTTDNQGPVYANVTGVTGASNAVHGENASATGKAIKGTASHATGINYGGYFSSASSAGFAGYFAATVAGGIPIYASAVDAADSYNVIQADKGNFNISINPRAANAGYNNPIVEDGDQVISNIGIGGAIDTGVLTLAPYATDAVGIRIDSTDDTVQVSGTLQINGTSVTSTLVPTVTILGSADSSITSGTISPSSTSEIEFELTQRVPGGGSLGALRLVLNGDTVVTNYYSAYSVDFAAPTKANNNTIKGAPAVSDRVFLQGKITPLSGPNDCLITISGTYISGTTAYIITGSVVYTVTNAITSVAFYDNGGFGSFDANSRLTVRFLQ